MSGRTPSPMLWRVCHIDFFILHGRSPLVEGMAGDPALGSPVLFRTTMTPFADRRERDGVAPSNGTLSNWGSSTLGRRRVKGSRLVSMTRTEDAAREDPEMARARDFMRRHFLEGLAASSIAMPAIVPSSVLGRDDKAAPASGSRSGSSAAARWRMTIIFTSCCALATSRRGRLRGGPDASRARQSASRRPIPAI